MKCSADVLVLAGDEIAAQDIAARVQEAGYKVLAMAVSVAEVMHALDSGSAWGSPPDVLVVDVDQVREAAARERVALVARRLDVPVIHAARRAEDLARAAAASDTASATESLLVFVHNSRELSLAIELALYRQGSARTQASDKAAASAPDPGSTEPGTSGQIQQLMADLSRRAAALEAANAELESFSYSVSHDLRAPLRAIEGFGKLLADSLGDKLEDPSKGYLRRIRQATQRMARLIDDLAKLSRVSRTVMQLEDCDLSAIAHEVVQELHKSEPQRTVDIVIQPGIHAHADPTLLRIVLESLLGNAWKFTARTAPARIEVGVVEHHGRPAYFVRDNGAGFDMAYVGKLFTPFQRLHTVDEFEGVGMGLATVKRIIQRHGGEVWATGEVGAGARVSFTLP